MASPKPSEESIALAKARAKAAIQEARKTFPQYAENFLRVRPKKGGVVPLVLNSSQLMLHEAVERQRKARGYVRLIIVKGRQQGISTYIAGRAYYIGTGTPGWKGFIITHRDDATANLWSMIRRFHDNMDARLRPHTKRDSAKGMLFDRIDAAFGVATAGGRGVGRSDTLNFFHGSEVAYWPNAEEHATGVLQAVPLAGAGTEAYLESTGNGMNNWFARQVRLALAGDSEFEVVFLPWFMHDEYQLPAKELRLTAEDLDYQQLHGLTDEQMAFRASKIAEFGGDEDARHRFCREYPATLDEAFQATDSESLISGQKVLRARRNTVDLATQQHAPLIYGCDPSYLGGDRFVIYARRGRWARRVSKWRKKDTVQSAMRCADIIRRDQPDAFIVEITGYGAGVYDQLKYMDLGRTQIIPYQGGEAPDDPEQYYNKRAECHGRLLDWFSEAPYPDIDDDDEIHADITAVQRVPDSRYRLKVESKEAMAKREIPSTDNLDGLVITFAAHVRPNAKGVPNPKRPVRW